MTTTLSPNLAFAAFSASIITSFVPIVPWHVSRATQLSHEVPFSAFIKAVSPFTSITIPLSSIMSLYYQIHELLASRWAA